MANIFHKSAQMFEMLKHRTDRSNSFHDLDEEKMLLRAQFMGIQNINHWKNIHQLINDELQRDQKKQRRMKQVLLISTRSCGKTTVFKQFHELNFKTSHNVTTYIRKHCVSTAIQICQMVGDWPHEQQLKSLSITNNEHLIQIRNIISTLWQNEAIKQKYLYKYIDKQFGDIILDNIEYYFTKIEEIMSVQYDNASKTMEDVLRCKDNYNEIKHIANETVHIADVPSYLFNKGKTKRLYMLDHVNTIIFVVALSDYCVYRNDVQQNALRYSMKCFEHIVNSKYTQSVDIILLLNKYDIFFEQIKRGIPLSVCFDHVSDGWDPQRDYGQIPKIMHVADIAHHWSKTHRQLRISSDIICVIELYTMDIFDENEHDHQSVDKYCTDALHFIQHKFQSLNKNKDKIVTSHALDAIDTNSIRHVFKNINLI